MRTFTIMLAPFALAAIFLGLEGLMAIALLCALGIVPLMLWLEMSLEEGKLRAKRKADLQKYEGLKARNFITLEEEQWMRTYENGLYWAAVGRGEIKRTPFDI